MRYDVTEIITLFFSPSDALTSRFLLLNGMVSIDTCINIDVDSSRSVPRRRTHFDSHLLS